jgi:hypothetical protein
MLYRFLRFLSKNGYFREEYTTAKLSASGALERRFCNTPKSDIIRSGHPFSVEKAFVSSDESFWPTFQHMSKLLDPDFKSDLQTHHFGEPIWKRFNMIENHEKLLNFQKIMILYDRLALGAIVGDFPWKDCQTIVDVGGASGSVVRAILADQPQMNGILFDLPEVVKAAQGTFSERVQLIGGSLFEADTIPKIENAKGRVCYILRSILHDWNDEKSVEILRNVGSKLRKTVDRLIILEPLVQEFQTATTSVFPIFSDLLMATLSGKERTAGQFEGLCESVGLELANITKTRSIYSAMTAIPK